MKKYPKSDDAYRTIGEVTKELGLIDKKTGHLKTHTLRYWETQFKQIKPNIRAGGRRYYSIKNIKIINYIKFLSSLTILEMFLILSLIIFVVFKQGLYTPKFTVSSRE